MRIDLLPRRDLHSMDPWVPFQASDHATERSRRAASFSAADCEYFISAHCALAAVQLQPLSGGVRPRFEVERRSRLTVRRCSNPFNSNTLGMRSQHLEVFTA
jgi:hypothetical protein